MFKLTQQEMKEISAQFKNKSIGENIYFGGPCDCTSCTGCNGCTGCATYGEYSDGWHAALIGKFSKV